jgi:CO dehydrogenase maturation factor
LAKNYDYTVIDSEAGMEHISRQTTRDIDILLIISDVTMRGIATAARMKDLIKEMRTKVGAVGLAVNRVKNGLPQEIEKAASDFGLELVATIPEDPNLAELDIKGKPIIGLPENSPLRQSVKDIVARFKL